MTYLGQLYFGRSRGMLLGVVFGTEDVGSRGLLVFNVVAYNQFKIRACLGFSAMFGIMFYY